MPSKKICFVTVGATAPFPALTTAALTTTFQSFLSTNYSYTHLIVQTGHSSTSTTPLPTSSDSPIQLETFELVPSLSSYIATADLVISHCGSGSVLEALRFGKGKLVTVPNPQLMDGHQEELAEELERQGYCVWGRLGEKGEGEEGAVKGLMEAVDRVEAGRKDEKGRWKKFPGPGEGLGKIIEAEMGFMGLD